MLEEDEENFAFDGENFSFHGKIIQTVIEEWGKKSLFEQNDELIRKDLDWMLRKYTPAFLRANLSWNDDPSLIDRGEISGKIYFIDEKEDNRCLDFYIMGSGTNINEYEKN